MKKDKQNRLIIVIVLFGVITICCVSSCIFVEIFEPFGIRLFGNSSSYNQERELRACISDCEAKYKWGDWSGVSCINACNCRYGGECK